MPQELEAEVPAAGDQLLNVLKPAFCGGGSVSDDALRKRFGGTPAANVSASTLNEVASGGSVEAFPLVRPTDEVCGHLMCRNDWRGIAEALPACCVAERGHNDQSVPG